MSSVKTVGAVGDICTHVITGDGTICDTELDARTIAIDLADIRKMRYRIGVAQGISKVPAICGALSSGIMNVFVTNEYTAEQVLKKLS